MSDSRHEKVYRFLVQHVPAERLARMMAELGAARERLLDWILRQDTDSAVAAIRISHVVPWLVRGFAGIEERGAATITETEFQQKTAAFQHAAGTVTNDRAFRKLWREYSGTLMNSILGGIDSGEVLIHRGSEGKGELPFDFALLGDDGDNLRVSFIVLGYPDDSPEKIQARMEERLGDRLHRQRSITMLFGDTLPVVEDRISVHWFHIGGGGTGDGEEFAIATAETPWSVIPFGMLLDSVQIPATEFRDYLRHSDAVDRYISDTGSLCDPVLNNARFSLHRRSLSMEEWAFTRPLMARHHKLFKHNQEVLTAIRLVSPLEVGINVAETISLPEWMDVDRLDLE